LRRHLIAVKKSLFAFKKIPVPFRRDFGAQGTEKTWKYKPEKSPKGAFSYKIPVKIPVSRDLP
jgi:hypothetical protein